MAVSTYHANVGRQGRVGAGYQGLRYDVPIGTFETRKAMAPVETYAEPVAEQVVEETKTPLDIAVEEAMVDVGDAQTEPRGYTPDYADPVSSGDPTSDPAFGGTPQGDPAVSPGQAAVEAGIADVSIGAGKRACKTSALTLRGYLPT